MKEGSHRARYERERLRKRRQVRQRRIAMLASVSTSLLCVGTMAALLSVLGRERALGLGIAAAIFALAFGIAARRTYNDGGGQTILWHVVAGLSAGLIASLALLIETEETWETVTFGAVLATMGGWFVGDEPDRKPKQQSAADEE